MVDLLFSSYELMFLCADAGANKIYGISDELSFISENQIGHIIDKTVDGLIQKEYICMDFDGNKTVYPKIGEIIKVISGCKKTLLLNRTINRECQESFLFYNDNREIVRLAVEGKEYKAEKITKEELFNELIPFSGETNCGQQEPSCHTLPAEVFSKAKELASAKKTEASKNLLAEYGPDNETSELIVGGFRGQNIFLSAVCSNVEVGNETTDGVVFVSDGRIAVDIKPRLIDEDEYVEISKTSFSDEISKLLCLLKNFGFISERNGEQIG